MARVWSNDNKYAKWLAVEIAVCEAWAEIGGIPGDALPAIRQASLDVNRMRHFEERTKHDVTAFLRAVGETVGEAARFIHLGLTSSDVVDTGLSLQIKEASATLEADLAGLRAALERRALEHKDTVMVGRTHGVHAEPTTFGFKLAVWVDEARRHQRRLREAAEQIAYGKISGAVGNHANVPPAVEEITCRRLGLQPAPVSTQVLQRDRHAHYLTTLALIASSLEKFATEIRGLQRTEVHEVEEPFGTQQTGSSAMPHKRNPELAERICGLARVVRGNAITAMEAIPLWHERDISNSSAERLIFPESCLLVDYCLRLMTRLVAELRVFPDRMRRNLESSYGLVYSQRVLLALIEKGLSRDDAYKLVQRNAMRAWDTEQPLLSLLQADQEVTRHLAAEELAGLFDIGYYLKHIDTAFARLGLLEAPQTSSQSSVVSSSEPRSYRQLKTRN
ncbi:MAG: adenylosuccinate lyase [Chloroflexi bacterium]|nr:adenylosuccinate lyase [Chloroflexota bacterium]